VLVTRVARFSCAEEAGIQPGDLLMALDGHAVSEEGETTFRHHERVPLEYLVTSKKIGDELTVAILRREGERPRRHLGFLGLLGLFGPRRLLPTHRPTPASPAWPAWPAADPPASPRPLSPLTSGAPSGPFDINRLAQTPGSPTPLELKVVLAPAHELVPRDY